MTTQTVDTIPEVTTAERLAADLRTLAKILNDHPELAEAWAAALSDLYLVLPVGSDISPSDHLAAALTHEATPVPPTIIEAMWDTRAFALPAGAVRASVTRLVAPWNSHDTDKARA